MRVRTDLGELNVEDVGAREAPPVLLWHSYLHHGGMWKAQIEALKTTHRVINVDAPGHGRSSPLGHAPSMEDCARAAIAVLDACDVERAIVVGLSWGGMVAMQLAITRPRRVKGIAVFDANCRTERLRNRVKYRAMATVLRTLGPVPALLDRAEPIYFSDGTLTRRRELVDDWRRHASRMDRESVWNALSCIVDRKDITDDLRRVDLPALVAVGADDRAQPPRESEWIANAIPRAQLAIIPDAGHLSALENPAAANAVLLPFLARC